MDEDPTDAFLDSLTPSQRRKVMGVIFPAEEVESTPEAIQPTSFSPIKIVLAVLLGLPIAAVGLFCVATIILIPVGLGLLFLSGYPLSRVLTKGLQNGIG